MVPRATNRRPRLQSAAATDLTQQGNQLGAVHHGDEGIVGVHQIRDIKVPFVRLAGGLPALLDRLLRLTPRRLRLMEIVSREHTVDEYKSWRPARGWAAVGGG